jgi:hypothetical protein
MADREVLKALKEHPWILAEHRDRAWRRIEQIMLQSRDIRAARASAEMIVNRTDPVPRAVEPDAPTRPIQVIIGVTGPATVAVDGPDRPALHAGPPLRTDGLRLHAEGGNGHGE